MGWSSANDIFDTVALSLEREFGGDEKPIVPVLRSRKTAILKALIEVLEQMDWDTADEVYGVTEAGDMALDAMGYHNQEQECEFNDDYTKCSCGWKER